MSTIRCSMALIAAVTLAVAACGGGERQGTEGTGAPAQPSAPATPGTASPDPGRQVITVEMETQADGSNVFEPATFDAKRGDVIRYVLESGVHNAHFLPDSNPGKANLPPATPLLQLPGQTYEIKVELAPGRYYFQCDPHALLGMQGHVTVTE